MYFVLCSPLCTLVFHTFPLTTVHNCTFVVLHNHYLILHYSPLHTFVFRAFLTTMRHCFACTLLVPHHYELTHTWVNSPSQAQVLLLYVPCHCELSLPRVQLPFIPFHYEFSPPPPKPGHYECTMNSPALPWQLLFICHHYEFSHPPIAIAIHPSPLRILPPSHVNCYSSVTTKELISPLQTLPTAITVEKQPLQTVVCHT